MYCKNCGSEIKEGAAFCPRCGAKADNPAPPVQPAAPVSPGPSANVNPGDPAPAKKKQGFSPLSFILGIGLSLALVAGLVAAGIFQFRPGAGGASVKLEGDGFDTPEEAVTAYAEALRDEDIDRMISTFAIETYASNYEPLKQYERVKAINPSNIWDYPVSSEEEGILANLDIEKRKHQITRTIVFQLETLAFYNGNSEDAAFQSLIEAAPVTDSHEFKNLLKKIQDIPDLSTIEIEDTIPPKKISKQYKQKVNLDILDEMGDIISAEDYVSVVLQMEVDGTPYYLTMDTACFDGRWYNVQAGGNIGSLMGISYTAGGLIPVDEFED